MNHKLPSLSLCPTHTPETAIKYGRSSLQGAKPLVFAIEHLKLEPASKTLKVREQTLRADRWPLLSFGVSGLGGPEWTLRICISNKVPEMLELQVWGWPNESHHFGQTQLPGPESGCAVSCDPRLGTPEEG